MSTQRPRQPHHSPKIVNESIRSLVQRIPRFLGTSPDFWMSLQLRWDLYHAQRAEAEQIGSIRPHELINAP